MIKKLICLVWGHTYHYTLKTYGGNQGNIIVSSEKKRYFVCPRCGKFLQKAD